jgi:hypothetical protein
VLAGKINWCMSGIGEIGAGGFMPNQKSRKKKAGVNKNKKLRAMRAKEAAAKPRAMRTATGKLSGRHSKFERTQDRPGAMARA